MVTRRFALAVVAFATLISVGSMGASAQGGGERTTAGSGNSAVTVVRVWGTPEEMGYWYGKLLAPEIAGCLKSLLALGIPEEALDAACEKMGPFCPPEYLEEIAGIAKGCAEAGHPEVTLSQLYRLHALPDVSEHGCSLYAAWGSATVGGKVYQLRSLDWNMDTDAQKYPVVTVYQPKGGQAYANVGFAGLTGVISGINASGVCVSEIMGGFGGTERLEGEPFPFVLRDVLAKAKTAQQGVDLVKNATRTNKYHYGIAAPNGEGALGRVLFTGPDVFLACGDNVTPEPPEVKAFFKPLKDVVYWRFDKGQGNEELYASLSKRHGKIDDAAALEIAKEAGTDGTLQSVLWNATDRKMWVAYAEGTETSVKQPYAEIDLKPLFAAR